MKLNLKENSISPSVLFFILFAFVVFIWSAINPKGYGIWLMETGPGIIGALLIIYYWKNFRLSNFLLIVICIHCCILFLGAKYTYAEVPLGFWMRDWFGFTRNNYDRIGHFIQGFTPVLLTREILIRNQIVKNKKWMALFCVAIALAFSAFYELIEFASALILGEGADEFLATQGDVWDTQMDMTMALCGAFVALAFSALHNRSISHVMKNEVQ